ncbi:MAG TPA: DUF4159 domain-containing protein, partial [Verrucomicrobiota bacterium]|nr:DUF4159 domain-containing protein [Verrucomicrobiota bacterium]
MKKTVFVLLIFLMALSVIFAQQRRSRRGFGGGEYGEGGWISNDARTAREVPSHSTGTPDWTNAPGFEKDVFTFVRIRRDRSPYNSGGSWSTDTPDSDLNFSFRLQQMTSIKVDPNGRYLRLTDPDLCEYPFIYMVEPGSLFLQDDEVVALRKYLLNGGFLMLDDFWGEREWAGMEQELKKVFPERNFVELPLDHPIYHCVFEITSKAQVPGISHWARSGGDTSERRDSGEVHHRAIFDDKGRMMVIAAHNTDNGDGWEREGEHPEYFRQFSEKIA